MLSNSNQTVIDHTKRPALRTARYCVTRLVARVSRRQPKVADKMAKVVMEYYDLECLRSFDNDNFVLRPTVGLQSDWLCPWPAERLLACSLYTLILSY